MVKFIQIGLAGINDGCVYALIALGFAIVFQVTRAVNLAQGAFCVLGALLGLSFGTLFGGALAATLAVAVMTATAIGVAVGAIAFVPALRRLPQNSVLMVTAGLLTAANGAFLLIWGNEPFISPPFSGEAPIALGTIQVPSQSFWIVGTSILAIGALRWLLYGTAFGKALRACSENPAAAQLVGIGVPRMTLAAFGMAAFLGALCGVMVAPLISLQFDTGSTLTILGFIAVTIGGINSFWGAIIGGLLLGLAKQLAAGYLPALAADAAPLCLLIAVLLIRPNGLLGAGPARRTDASESTAILRPVVRLGPGERRLAAVIGAIILFGGAYPFLDSGIASSLVVAVIIGISLIGLDVLVGFCGQISLGHAGFMAIGGYAAAYLTATIGLPSPVAILVGMAISAAAAFALARATAHLRGIYLALSTLSFGLLVDSIAVNAIEITGGPAGFVGVPSLSFGRLAITTQTTMFYFAAAIFLTVAVALAGAMRSDFGRALQAIRTDPMAAAALGIKVDRYRTAAFVISAVLGSLSGSLYAFSFQFLSPDMVNTARSFELIAMLVLGGEGTLVGGLIGAFVLTVLPTLFQVLADYKTLATGLLLIVVFRFIPGGLLGVLLGAVGRRSARARSPGPVPTPLQGAVR